MRRLLPILLLAALLQTGCGSLQRIDETLLGAQIAQAEARWQGHAIESYHLRVRKASLWHVQTESITVQDGIVIEHRAVCVVAPLETDGTCDVEPVDVQMYTVEGLFATSRQFMDALSSDNVTIASQRLSLQFDPIYGLPTLMTSSPTEVTDAGASWVIEEFEPLP